jgi:beta-lactam-binding protein with PASTA domain
MFGFITKLNFFVNLLAAIILLVALLFVLLWALGFITKHGEHQTVPKVVGLHVDEAIKVLEDKGFAVQVQDSVWKAGVTPLSVVRQTPDGDQLVKAARRIYLTINRSQPPLVDLPVMVGLSFRNASLYLQQLGLELGDTTRRPDIAKDAVLEMKYNGRIAGPGTKVFLGSKIDFVLGSGLGTEEIEMPDLRGLTFKEAKALITGLGLTVANPLADAGVKDTANAYVYRQNPPRITLLIDGSKQINKIRPGQNVDLWLSVERREILDTLSAPNYLNEDN